MSLRCCICGRYCEYDADSSVPFGDSSMMEPPDPDFYCHPCIEISKEYYRENNSMPVAWIPAIWHLDLAVELGYALGGYAGASWSSWYRTGEPLPAGYVWRS